MKAYAVALLVGLLAGFSGAGPLWAYYSDVAEATGSLAAATEFAFSDDFTTYSGWTYAASALYPDATSRTNVGGEFASDGNNLTVATFGAGDAFDGPIARRPLGMTVATDRDFELSAKVASGATGNGEVRFGLVTDLGVHVASVSWMATCGDGSGEIDFHHAVGAFDGAYDGCGSANATFAGTLALRREGATWTGLVDGVPVASWTGASSDAATHAEILMTLPSGTARDLRVDHVEVRLL